MDVQTLTLRPLRRACALFLNDLNVLPEEAFTRDWGGKARRVVDLVHEVNMVNDDIARTVRGEPIIEWPEGWITAPPEMNSKAAAIAAFETSSQALLAAFEAVPADRLLEPVECDGEMTDRYERSRFATLHLWYHLGQLNFMQTLLGDDQFHW